jgi:hypothetical protein
LLNSCQDKNCGGVKIMKLTIDANILYKFMDFTTIKIEGQNLIATNDTLACVQHLNTDNTDNCYINVTKELVKIVYNELNKEGFLTFETISELAMGSVTDSNGHIYTDIIVWPDESPLDNWREWFRLSEESQGFMFANLEQLETLWKSSPSGNIVFPEVINASEPVIVRDVTDANWVGVFIPSLESKATLKAATLPEWLNAD